MFVDRILVTIGYIGMVLHHYRIGFFAPEHSALTFGAIALVGIALLFRK